MQSLGFYREKKERKNWNMKTKPYLAALLTSLAMIVPAYAGGHHGGGGGGASLAPAGHASRGGGAPSFRGMAGRSFSGGRIYSGQRFYSSNFRSAPSMHVQRNYATSHVAPIRSRQFTSGNTNFSRRTARTATALNRSGQVRNTSQLKANWRNHVVAQHSPNWQRNWARNRDHWWHGHRCRFIDGSWVIFDFGYDPFWPYWGYPYDYAYGYGYPYSYDYDPGYYYDSTVYPSEPSYGYQSSNSIVVAAQQQLAEQGYYRGQIDGVIGPQTEQAIAQFQNRHGLQVTGSLSPDTIAALGLQRVASY